MSIPHVEPGSVDLPQDNSASLGEIISPWVTIISLARIALILAVTLGAVAVIALLWQVVGFFGSLLLLFFGAWLISLVLAPMIRQLIHWHLPKPLAIVVTLLLVIAVLVGVVIVIVPGLIDQTTTLGKNIGPSLTTLASQVTTQLGQLGITVNLSSFSGQLQSLSQNVLQALLGVVTALPSLLFQLVLLIIITILLVSSTNYDDAPTRTTAEVTAPASAPPVSTFIPQQWRDGVTFVRTSFEASFGQFFRGQLLTAVIFGVVTGVLLWLTGYSYAVTTGCICGLLMIIPFFGGPLSFIPLLIVTLSSNRPVPLTIVDLLVFYIVQTLLLNIFLPRVVGKSSGLGPISTLFVLLAGAQVGGLFGTLIAVPLVGTINAVVGRLMVHVVAPAATRSAIPGKTSVTPAAIRADTTRASS